MHSHQRSGVGRTVLIEWSPTWTGISVEIRLYFAKELDVVKKKDAGWAWRPPEEPPSLRRGEGRCGYFEGSAGRVRSSSRIILREQPRPGRSGFLPRRFREVAPKHSSQPSVGRREAIMNFMDAGNLGLIDLLERSLDGL